MKWSAEVGVERVPPAGKQAGPPGLFHHVLEGEQGEDILLTSIFCSQELHNLMFLFGFGGPFKAYLP